MPPVNMPRSDWWVTKGTAEARARKGRPYAHGEYAPIGLVGDKGNSGGAGAQRRPYAHREYAPIGLVGDKGTGEAPAGTTYLLSLARIASESPLTWPCRLP
jgi:hypothetical protein